MKKMWKEKKTYTVYLECGNEVSFSRLNALLAGIADH